jgi:hypothetical protein
MKNPIKNMKSKITALKFGVPSRMRDILLIALTLAFSLQPLAFAADYTLPTRKLQSTDDQVNMQMRMTAALASLTEGNPTDIYLTNLTTSVTQVRTNTSIASRRAYAFGYKTSTNGTATVNTGTVWIGYSTNQLMMKVTSGGWTLLDLPFNFTNLYVRAESAGDGIYFSYVP